MWKELGFGWAGSSVQTGCNGNSGCNGNPVTKNEAVTKIQEIEAEKRRRGRPRKADALTGAQRVARHRAKRRGGG